MNNKIILIRHGQSTANVDTKLYYGPDENIVLTSKGEYQSKVLGRTLHQTFQSLMLNDEVTVIASGMVRAQLTAKHALHRFKHVSIKHDHRISECDWGDSVQVESSRSVLTRVKSLIDDHPTGSLILFTHCELMRIVDPISGAANNTEYRIYDRRRFQHVFMDRVLLK